MAQKNKRMRKERPAEARATRGRARRTMRAAKKAKPAAGVTTPKSGPQQESAGTNRSEGIRLFAVAGRPSKDDFVAVYGTGGPRMTWAQRAAAGIPAERFQDALASAKRHAK
jgi:hypothetical protein